MWIGFSLFSKNFVYEVTDEATGEVIQEPFCNSSFQCLLTFWSTGLFSGGTSDMTGLVSYKQSPNIFLQMFLYNFMAFILVNTIFGNIFTGLITDAFGGHREKTEHFEEDRDNLCYICDFSRATASVKGINFNAHIEEHSFVKYIKFLIYLFLKDPDDFTLYEKVIFDLIIENDIYWIPYKGDSNIE